MSSRRALVNWNSAAVECNYGHKASSSPAFRNTAPHVGMLKSPAEKQICTPPWLAWFAPRFLCLLSTQACAIFWAHGHIFMCLVGSGIRDRKFGWPAWLEYVQTANVWNVNKLFMGKKKIMKKNIRIRNWAPCSDYYAVTIYTSAHLVKGLEINAAAYNNEIATTACTFTNLFNCSSEVVRFALASRFAAEQFSVESLSVVFWDRAGNTLTGLLKQPRSNLFTALSSSNQLELYMLMSSG